jgi:hypothetical protein
MGSAKAAGNAKDHGVTFEQAATVFLDARLLSQLDEKHGEGEERWLGMGHDPDHLGPPSDGPGVQGLRGTEAMKKEYDFSRAARGRFYRAGAKLVNHIVEAEMQLIGDLEAPKET